MNLTWFLKKTISYRAVNTHRLVYKSQFLQHKEIIAVSTDSETTYINIACVR